MTGWILNVVATGKRMDATTAWTIIGALTTALLGVTAWGVKQARGKEKLLREWLDSTREQLKLVNLVNDINRDRR